MKRPDCTVRSSQGCRSCCCAAMFFVSLSTGMAGEGIAAAGGALLTRAFKLPACPGKPLVLHLNIFTAIGRGASAALQTEAG